MHAGVVSALTVVGIPLAWYALQKVDSNSRANFCLPNIGFAYSSVLLISAAAVASPNVHFFKSFFSEICWAAATHSG